MWQGSSRDNTELLEVLAEGPDIDADPIEWLDLANEWLAHAESIGATAYNRRFKDNHTILQVIVRGFIELDDGLTDEAPSGAQEITDRKTTEAAKHIQKILKEHYNDQFSIDIKHTNWERLSSFLEGLG